MTGTDYELIDERYDLAIGRIKETLGEDAFTDPLLSFFRVCSDFLCDLSAILDRSLAGTVGKVSAKELAAENHKLYEDILPQNYGKSFANPDFIVKEFEDANIPEAKQLARYLSFIICTLST